MKKKEFPDVVTTTGKFFLWILFLTAGILALLITIYMPFHRHSIVFLNVLFVLTILAIIYVVLDKLDLEIDIFLEISHKNAKTEILLCLFAFVLFFILPNLRDIIGFAVSTFIFTPIEKIFTLSVVDTLITTQLNIAAETVLINGFAIGLAYIFRRRVPLKYIRNDALFWIYAMLFSFIFACVSHLGSYVFVFGKTIEEGFVNLIPVGLMFSLFTMLGILRSNILIIYTAHAGWNLGVMFAVALAVV